MGLGFKCRHIPPSVYCGGKKRRRRRSKRRRSRCGRSRRRKSCRGGRKTNNPFLNYLRVFRKKHCGWPQCRIAIEGAKCWCKMSGRDRKKYYNQACSMLKKRGRRRRRRSCRRRRRSCRRRRRRRRSCNTCPK
ncbi:protamine [Anthonomus grandis grandis]|uniref:Protamine n=1 Tax=Anthonomus grandis TaxID=7044 RepID=PRT_ANTGR|nr:protamine [Anthonomus grandis grandis]P17502.1 RecName: Full=Protamine [Anthonomus grandis]CAA36282.1 unnamed protein product [Anthonomus grandis]